VSDSSVGIATDTGWKVLDTIPVGTRISACAERPWRLYAIIRCKIFYLPGFYPKI